MKLLINKQTNPLTNESQLISTQHLMETENIVYEIIDNVPAIEARDGYTGKYIWNNTTNQLDVEYTKNPITTEERITAMQEVIDTLVMGGM